MDRDFKKPVRKRLLLGLVLGLLVILAIPFYKHPVSKRPFTTRQAGESEKKVPVKFAKSVLRSSIAGRWYTADTKTLKGQIAGLFEQAVVEPIDNVIALILPHAGYQYSGQTAVLGLKTTDKKYKRIIVIGPSHGIPMEETLSVPRVTHYETPLGQTPLDVEFIDRLLEYSLFHNVPQAHQYEHSVQIELPLLQYARDDFMFVPIVAGTCSPKTISKAGAILRGLVDDETLVIASSDFVHYGPNYGYVPFRENIPEELKKVDMGAYEQIASLDYKAFLEYKSRTGATICGYVPIAILLSMLDKTAEAKLIKYTTSGELTGGFTNSVSYLSVAFSGRWENLPRVEPQHNNPGLTKEDKEKLLVLARRSLVHFLQKRQIPEPSEIGITISEEMKPPRAAFVTFKKNAHLRGCIGDIFPRQPLYKSVITNAINAGINDRRFAQVTEAEFNNITIEISALTVPEPVSSAKDIKIGIDGVVLNKEGRMAVFLPQVASEQGWDLNTTLTQLSLKAGLPANAWKKGANFLVFQADVFGEEK